MLTKGLDRRPVMVAKPSGTVHSELAEVMLVDMEVRRNVSKTCPKGYDLTLALRSSDRSRSKH